MLLGCIFHDENYIRQFLALENPLLEYLEHIGHLLQNR